MSIAKYTIDASNMTYVKKVNGILISTQMLYCTQLNVTIVMLLVSSGRIDRDMLPWQRDICKGCKYWINIIVFRVIITCILSWSENINMYSTN